MKIRKSRLKQIIKEEVSSFKFIPINEGVDPEVEKQVLSDAINSLQALANAVDTHNDLGLENNANGILASVIENLQSLMNPVSEDSSPSTLLDEIVVQEIVKALGEAGEHEKIDAPKGIANKEYAKSIAAYRKKMHDEDPELKHRIAEEEKAKA